METTVDKALDNNRIDAAVPDELEKPRTRLSVADGIYALIVIGAAIIRFSGLDQSPLSPDEAQQALSSWQFLQPEHLVITAGSPAYTTFTTMLMSFFGASDVTARIVPALFGVGLAILPWLLRRRLGQIGALVAAALFAVSPLFAAVSRSAGGNAIALFAILLLFISALRMRSEVGRRWLYLAGAALGLGLASSPLFYSGLVTMTVARFAQQLISPEEEETYQPERPAIINAVLIGALIMILISTRFFAYLAGLGAAAQIFSDWLAQFGLQGDLQTLIAPFLILGQFELLLLPLGITAIIWAVWRNHSLGTLFTYWVLTGMVLLLLQRGELSNTLLLPLAGYMLLGLASQQLLRQGRNRWTWAVSGIVSLVGAVVLVNTARFLRVSLVEQQVANLWIAMMSVAAAVLFFYYFWSEQKKSIMQGIWLGILALFILYQWGTAWNLTHKTANDPRQSWIQQATDNDLLELIKTVRDISRTANNSDYGIPLFSAVDTPVLRWYLRDFAQVEFGHTLPLGAQYELIISPASILDPALGDDYMGGDFGLLRSKMEEDYYSASPLLDALRWSLFHESTRGVAEERIILWVRADVAEAQ